MQLLLRISHSSHFTLCILCTCAWRLSGYLCFHSFFLFFSTPLAIRHNNVRAAQLHLCFIGFGIPIHESYTRRLELTERRVSSNSSNTRTLLFIILLPSLHSHHHEQQARSHEGRERSGSSSYSRRHTRGGQWRDQQQQWQQRWPHRESRSGKFNCDEWSRRIATERTRGAWTTRCGSSWSYSWYYG